MKKLTKDLKKISDKILSFDGNVFDSDTNIIIKIICAGWMFLIIGFLVAGVLSIILNLSIFEFAGLGFVVLLLYIVYRLFGLVSAYALLIILPLIILLFNVFNNFSNL